MFQYEIKKLFFKKSLLIILCIFTVIDIVKIGQEYQKTTYLTDEKREGMLSWKEAYWKLYKTYGGKITEEKIENFLEYFQPLRQQTADLTAGGGETNPDYLTGSVWGDYYLLERYYMEPMQYYYRYGKEAGAVCGKAKENVSFYRSRGNDYESKKNALLYHLYQGREISDFSYTEMWRYYLNYYFSNVLIFLLCIYGIVRVFVCEKEAKMEDINLVNINGGRKLAAQKIKAVTLYIFLVCLWFALVDFFAFAFFFQSTEAAQMPVYAIETFTCASVGCKLWQYAVLAFLVRTIGFLVFGMLFLLFSQLCKNALLPFVLSMVTVAFFVFVDVIYGHSVFVWGKVCNPYTLIVNQRIFGKTEFVNVFGLPVLSYEAACIAGILGYLVLAIGIWRLARKNILSIGRNPFLRRGKERKQRLAEGRGHRAAAKI